MIHMAFIFFCFTGIFVMFFYLMRSLEKFQELTRDEHAHLRVQIRALEARLDVLAGAAPAQQAPSPAPVLPADEPLAPAPKDHPDAAPDDPLMLPDPKPRP